MPICIKRPLHSLAAVLSASLMCAMLSLTPSPVAAQAAREAVAPNPKLPTVDIGAGMHVIRAEVADEPGTRMRGLMMRERLGTNEGMLFVFPDKTRHCFWMRNTLVPLNKKYPIKELLEACRNYPGLSNARRITFEYVMLKGVNDSDADARELVRLLKGIPAKINLIPFNPWPGTKYECSDWDRIEAFSEIVFRAGYASPVRTPRGRDILAACGQLKSETEKLRARARLMLETGLGAEGVYAAGAGEE